MRDQASAARQQGTDRRGRVRGGPVTATERSYSGFRARFGWPTGAIDVSAWLPRSGSSIPCRIPTPDSPQPNQVSKVPALGRGSRSGTPPAAEGWSSDACRSRCQSATASADDIDARASSMGNAPTRPLERTVSEESFPSIFLPTCTTNPTRSHEGAAARPAGVTCFPRHARKGFWRVLVFLARFLASAPSFAAGSTARPSPASDKSACVLSAS